MSEEDKLRDALHFALKKEQRVWGSGSPHEEAAVAVAKWRRELAQALDKKYQDGFKTLLPGQDCPPCPDCGGKMIPWDAWLVTGAQCESCGWNMNEGTGCLL